jgi:hypothetical protein
MGILGVIKATVRRVAAKLRWKSSPGVIGTPSARMTATAATNPSIHAVQFVHEWSDRLEQYVEGRMHTLQIPEHPIGHGDPDDNIPWRVFFPHGTTGRSVIGEGIGVDSGVLNSDLLIKPYGLKVAKVWAESRLRDRIDAVIAHEQQEGLGLFHVEAVRRAVETPLAITEGARRILRAMAHAERES